MYNAAGAAGRVLRVPEHGEHVRGRDSGVEEVGVEVCCAQFGGCAGFAGACGGGAVVGGGC